MGLLTKIEKAKIVDAIREAERKTAGELVLVVAARSGNHAEVRGGVALALGVVLTQEVQAWFPAASAHQMFWFLGALTVVLYWLFGWGPLLRLLVPRAQRERVAHRRALQAFAEEGVTETEGRSGVLIFLSEAEHQIVVLADRGICERVDDDEWDRDVQLLIAGFKAGEPAKSLLQVIERIGGLLASAFPPCTTNPNELSDEIRER